MARTRWPPGPENPGLLPRPGRSDRHHRWVPRPGARPTDRVARQPQRRQPNSRSGRDPGTRPYALTSSKRRKQGRSTYPHTPCRIRSACRGVVSLSLAGPGSDYVRRDDTAGGLGASRSCYARYGTMVLPAGPEEALVLGYPRVGRLRTSPPRAGRRRDEFWPLRSGLQRPALAIVACP